MTLQALVSFTAVALGLAWTSSARAEDTSSIGNRTACKKQLKGSTRAACMKCMDTGDGFFNKIDGKWQCGGDLGGTTVAQTNKGDPPPAPLKSMPATQKNYVTVPAGTFRIGTAAPPDGSYRPSAELDANITITRPFQIKTTEVTEGEWYFVMKKMPKRYKAGSLDRPVTYVSWLDAVAYLNALSKLEKLEPCYTVKGKTDEETVVTWKGLDCTGYRLPTDAEWEYAARGGSKDAVWGPMDEIAWYEGNSASTRHPVGEKKANGYGIHDMLGNVAEHVWDAYEAEAFAKDQTDPVIGGFEMKDIYTDRGYRGLDYMMGATGATVAYRGSASDPNMGGGSIGFRPVRTVKK